MPGLTHAASRAAALALLALGACSDAGAPALDLAGAFRQERTEEARQIGDPDAGRAVIASVGCGACHIIPGVAGAQGLVGPPLTHMARRQYIAGVLRNTPDNMMAWISDPQRIVPGNAMPEMGLDDAQVRNVTAYLATLQ